MTGVEEGCWGEVENTVGLFGGNGLEGFLEAK